jgi:hypothetical protein
MEAKLKLLVDTSSELIDATLYRQIIGSWMYLMNTRPGICFAVNTLIQFLVEPRHVHLVAAKHVMRYLKGTIDYGLSYDGDHDFTLSGYTVDTGKTLMLFQGDLVNQYQVAANLKSLLTFFNLYLNHSTGISNDTKK